MFLTLGARNVPDRKEGLLFGTLLCAPPCQGSSCTPHPGPVSRPWPQDMVSELGLLSGFLLKCRETSLVGGGGLIDWTRKCPSYSSSSMTGTGAKPGSLWQPTRFHCCSEEPQTQSDSPHPQQSYQDSLCTPGPAWLPARQVWSDCTVNV